MRLSRPAGVVNIGGFVLIRGTRKAHPDVPDLPTAAFLTAIHEGARRYMEPIFHTRRE